MTNTIITSNDVIIRDEKTIDVVIRELDGKIDSVIVSVNGLQRKILETFSAQQKQLDELRAETRVIHERINSIADKLGNIQYTLSCGVSVITLLFAALPVVWAVRKMFSFSVRDAVRKAVREELDARSGQADKN